MPLPTWELNHGDTAICPACGSSNVARVYPAALAERAVAETEAATEGEASCFDHPAKRAVAACGHCGRFVCQLCAIQYGSATWCPSCVANPKGKIPQARSDTSRSLYDTWALTIPFALIVMWPLTIFSAPAVIALALMKRKQPISLVRRNRWRLWVGLTVAVGEGVGWIWLIWYAVAKAKSGA
jgi:hypothetical protein